MEFSKLIMAWVKQGFSFDDARTLVMCGYDPDLSDVQARTSSASPGRASLSSTGIYGAKGAISPNVTSPAKEAASPGPLASVAAPVPTIAFVPKTPPPPPPERFEDKVMGFFLGGKSKAEAIRAAVAEYPVLHAEWLDRVQAGNAGRLFSPEALASAKGITSFEGAVQHFEGAVQHFEGAGKTRGQALEAAATHFPELHVEWLSKVNTGCQQNAQLPGHRKVSEGTRGDTDQFLATVRVYQAQGKSKGEAIKLASMNFPALHQTWLEKVQMYGAETEGLRI